MRENIKESYIIQSRKKGTDHKWSDDKWCKTLDEVTSYMPIHLKYTNTEEYDIRLIKRVSYDEVVESVLGDR